MNSTKKLLSSIGSNLVGRGSCRAAVAFSDAKLGQNLVPTKLPQRLSILLSLSAVAFGALAADLPYQIDFENSELESVPDDFLVLDGGFAVKEKDGNKFIELPGAPLDTFGLLFGPAVKEGVTASARFYGEIKGRRAPTFDVGLNGVGGYRLRVSPGKRQLELFRSDALKKSEPLEWKGGKWTWLKLTVLKQADGAHRVEGRFWQEGASEPAEPTILFVDADEPPAGRASIFGSPYSGAPIRFDDLSVKSAK